MSNKETPIPKRLKEAREAAGLSQKQLGIKAGIDEFSASSRMNQYETGKHTSDYFTIKKIAEVLALPTSYFYTEEDNLAKIIQLAGKLSLENKNKLLKYLNRF